MHTLPAVTADLGHAEGTLVRVTPSQIVLTNRDQTAAVAYPLGPFVRVTRNGQTATLRQLARGDRVQVLTETRLGREFVTTILAIQP